MKVLDCCAGVGSFSLGFEAAGIETVAFCEWDKHCRKVLDKHWPDVPKYEDLKELTAEKLRNDGIKDIGIISAGIPCQGYSRAGKRKGRNDDRDLAQTFVELVADIKPTVVITENTEGFIDLGLVPYLDDMEEKGYFSETLSVPSCAIGLPSMERHIWIISTPDKERCKRIAEASVQIITDMQEQFQGSDTRIPDRWQFPAARLCGMGERITGRTHRLEQIGNAAPPKMLEILGTAILGTENVQRT